MALRLKVKTNRRSRIVRHTEKEVIASYTLSASFLQAYTLVGPGKRTRYVLPAGHVVAFDPVTRMVVPHFLTYGYPPIGPILIDADAGIEGTNNPVVPVLWRGEAWEDACWDDGDYGTVLSSTKAALIGRITFIKNTSKVRW